MLPNQIKRRPPAVGSLISLLLLALSPIGRADATGVSFSGITEASSVTLAAGMPTTNLSLTATPTSPAGATNMVFVVERQGANFRQFTSAPPYSVTLSNLPAGKYFLSAALLAPGIAPGGDLSFDVLNGSRQPANDNWNSASVIPSLNTTLAMSNTYATVEPGEPAHAGVGAGKTIWWSWTAVSNGIFTATTVGSAFDTVLAVYRGTNVNALVELAANDDAGPHAFSQATFPATNGLVYFFAVDSASAATFGNARLRLVAGAPPTIVIASPPDGTLFLVASPSVTTNTSASAAISDPTGIAGVDYWFDGSTGMSRSGVVPPPYQLSLTNLVAGHYVLTYAASNNVGLISLKSIGLSVISLAPILMLEGLAASGKFSMGVTGFKGPNYALLASSNLDVWCSIKTWTNFAGAEKIADTNAAQFTRRFYRASSQ